MLVMKLIQKAQIQIKIDYREKSRSRDNSMSSKGVNVEIKNLPADLEMVMNQN